MPTASTTSRHKLPMQRLRLIFAIFTLAASISFASAALFVEAQAHAQSPTPAALAPALRDSIDRSAREVLASSGAPSASIAVVQNREIAYTQAYGDAHLDPRTPARTDMRYSIGSISKQFTSTAVLMLMEEGKLSLDDPVRKFLPGLNLTRANEVTIRQILSHTAGYQDYWPQDYVPPFMEQAVSAQEIVARWAKKPLDFEPGTRWQYSNTGYVIAGMIVEKVSGTPLLEFLRSRIFKPLGMESIVNVDLDRLTGSDPAGYLRYALGPPRPAPKEAKGWLFAAGELAMTAGDLAKWDIATIDQRLLKPASYKEMQTAVRLKSGASANYALGIRPGNFSGHRVLEHSGEVSGFSAENMIFPDDRAAVMVLTNIDNSDASGEIARRVAGLLLRSGGAAAPRTERARAIFGDLQHGKIDRSLFSSNGNSYFTDEALHDFASSLGPLGAPDEFVELNHNDRGGMTHYEYRASCGKQVVLVSVFELPDGKIEQYMVSPAD